MKLVKYLALAGGVAIAAAGVFALNSRASQATADDQAVGGKWRQRVREQLNLSDDQVAKIEEQLKAEKGNITGLLTRLHDAREQLRTEIQKPDATETSVREAAAKVSAVESDMAVERMKLHAKISPILTADQRARLGKLEAGDDQFIERAIARRNTRLEE